MGKRENERGPQGEALDFVWTKSIGDLRYPLSSGPALWGWGRVSRWQVLES